MGYNLREMNSTRIERKDSRRWRCPPKKKKNYESLTVDNREENKLEAWQRDSILWSAVNNKERKAKMD